MKKIIAILLTAALLIGFAACGKKDTVTSQAVETESSVQNESETVSSGKKILTVYFSWSGNTDAFAGFIHKSVGGDTVRIVPQTAYPEGYQEVVDLAKQEKNDNARPKFKELGVNPEDYDVIFVGYPIWWYTMPMILYTFFETYDFAGKTIIPFNTHEGSGDSGTYDTIKELEPQATVLEGRAVRGNKITGAESEVNEWLKGLNY